MLSLGEFPAFVGGCCPVRKPYSMQWQMKKEVEAKERLVPDFEKTAAYEEKVRQLFFQVSHMERKETK